MTKWKYRMTFIAIASVLKKEAKIGCKPKAPSWSLLKLQTNWKGLYTVKKNNVLCCLSHITRRAVEIHCHPPTPPGKVLLQTPFASSGWIGLRRRQWYVELKNKIVFCDFCRVVVYELFHSFRDHSVQQSYISL